MLRGARRRPDRELPEGARHNRGRTVAPAGVRGRAGAHQLHGASDLFEWSGGAPQASINYIAAHDGFTLADCIAYTSKRNEENGESNRDGRDENFSFNCGVEGPTSDPAVPALRDKQQRNLLLTLLLSQGVPMLLAGDELRRTKGGNNNSFCQDNTVNYLNWELLGEERVREFHTFFARAVALRMSLAELHCECYVHGLARNLPVGFEAAETGCWRQGPGHDSLDALLAGLLALQPVAKDLGTITPEVDALRDAFSLPGLRVLQFGFDGAPDNPRSPGNVSENMVMFTGMHDNDTSVGWYASVEEWQRALIDAELGRFARSFPESLIECAFASPARTVVVPLQDLLALDAGARINTPGTMTGNWQWRLPEEIGLDRAASMMRELAELYGR